jgi:hypothetical protein
MTDVSKPDKRRGVWGTVGQVKKDQKVYFCVTGEALIRLHPELEKDRKKYCRPGVMWEVRSLKQGKYRRMRLQLTHWNPDNPKTDEKSREVYETLKEECEGVLDVHQQQKDGLAAKV